MNHNLPIEAFNIFIIAGVESSPYRHCGAFVCVLVGDWRWKLVHRSEWWNGSLCRGGGGVVQHRVVEAGAEQR